MAIPSKNSKLAPNGFHVYHRESRWGESDRFEHMGHFETEQKLNKKYPNHEANEDILVREVRS